MTAVTHASVAASSSRRGQALASSVSPEPCLINAAKASGSDQ
jgi:hypothetical protein